MSVNAGEKVKPSQKIAISHWPVTPEATGSGPVTPAILQTFLGKKQRYQTFPLFCPFYVLFPASMIGISKSCGDHHKGVVVIHRRIEAYIRIYLPKTEIAGISQDVKSNKVIFSK